MVKNESKTLIVGKDTEIDCGNPRYAASKVPSQVGPLIGQKPSTFVTYAHYNPMHKPSNSIDIVEQEESQEDGQSPTKMVI